MIEEFLVWLLAAYGCSSLLVALFNWLALRPFPRPGETLVYYQVLLRNSEQTIEGVVRCLMNASLLRGTPIHISFVDYGSTDDTVKITEVFERNYEFLAGATKPDAELTPITIDLRKAEEEESKT